MIFKEFAFIASIKKHRIKSGENIKSKSLAIYRKTYQPRISIRFSLKNLSLDDGMMAC